tara:strand:+ start:13188 stop:13808 length:621 start_codon:yes stop_codon:yes gene_type:complete
MTNKSIDINQRIPLDTLYAALEAYLNDSYSNEYVLEQLRLDFTGENRLKKALRIVNRTITGNPLKTFLDDNREVLNLAITKKTDRNIILIALLNSAFPFSFDVLSVFGKYFSVQEIINTDTIKKTISNTYGGNRATENGMYSVVPMFLEAGFFKRPKMGVYQSLNKLNAINSVTTQIYKESYKVNNQCSSLSQYQYEDPYFSFIAI